jgi:hypothetical protein
MDKSGFRKRYYTTVGSCACVLLVLVWVFIKGGLSPRGFGLAVLICWIAMFAVLFPLIRSWQRSAEDVRRAQIASGASSETIDQCMKNIRSMKRIIVMFAVFLGYGLWATQGDPLLPRFIGAAFDLLILAVCINSLIRSQKKLKGITVGPSTKASDAN